jgi:hypothetical protein
MRNPGVLIFFVIILLSCKSSVPKEVLPPKKMQAVIWDVMQADEMAEYYSTKDSTFTNLSKHAEYYQKIFSIHKITKEDFTKSLTYYENHPVVFKTVLDSLKSFAERVQRADSLTKVKTHVVDSAAKKTDTLKKMPSLNKTILSRKHH